MQFITFRRLATAIVAMVCLPGLVLGQTPPRDVPPAPKKGIAVIRGTVFAAQDGRALRRVQLQLSALGEASQPQTTSTDENGRYEFTELPAGRFTVSARRSGFLPARFGQWRPRELATPVTVTDGQILERVDIALQKMSGISGRVLDEIGDPISGAIVVAMRAVYLNGRRQMIPTGTGLVRTDDDGDYRLSLPPGTYIVFARSVEKWTVSGGRVEETMGYATTYFPGTTSMADATRITVGLGKDVGGVGFSLIPGRVAAVSGTALDSAGRPFRSVGLSLDVNAEGYGFFSSAGSATIAVDGTFAIRDVGPGEYRLSAVRFEPDPEVASIPIAVEGFDLQNISLRGSAGGTVSGRVALEQGITAERPRVRINLTERSFSFQPDPSRLGAFRGTTGFAVVAADGTFSLAHVFGPARFGVSLPDGWMVKSIVHEGRDIADAPVDLSGGDRLSDVLVTITNRITAMGGVVADRTGAPRRDATVVVFAADARKWSEESRFVRAARPDGEGRYQITGLPPGDYLAVAVDYLEDGAWHEPALLASLRSRAQKVTLSIDAPITLPLVLVTP